MGTHKFKTWRDPYDVGFSTTRAKEITINTGLTVLVGCNGAGKTTLLHNIESELEEEGIPCLFYDNKIESTNSLGTSIFKGNFSLSATMICSSEGENITINLGEMVKSISDFLKTGKTKEDVQKERLKNIFDGIDCVPEISDSKERWILLDAVDSGYSIDNIIDLKHLFSLILNDSKDMNLKTYIVVSCNEYELANGEQCFDVMNGNYITFKDYEDFKKFILNSRAKKEKREERLK